MVQRYSPTAARAPARRRSARALRWVAPLSLALLGPAAGAAVFAPGHAEPDPPTGDILPVPEPRAAEPLRVPGFQWVLGPWRSAGTITADLRWLRLGNGLGSRGLALGTEMEWATHLWQPWFVQMRFGLGLVSARDSSQDGGGDNITGRGSGLSARMALSLFPASRFPMELRVELGDNRSGADSLGRTVRQQRLAWSQSWRPEQGNRSLHLQLDHSRLQADEGDDILTSLQLGGQMQQGVHHMDASVQVVHNRRTELDEQQRVASVNARHGFLPRPDLQVETLANWNDNQLHSGRRIGDDLGTSVAQLSSLLSWRPREGDPLYHPDRPVQVAASVRWSQVSANGQGDTQRAQTWSATAGASVELPPAWRLSASLAAVRLQNAGLRADSTNLSSSLGWTPAGLAWGPWRYMPSASLNLGASQGSDSPSRTLIGMQASHGLSRDWSLEGGGQVAVNITQSAAVVRESATPDPVRGIAHSLGLFWQGGGDTGQQRYASLSFSDSRSHGAGSGQFQLANLQLNQRTQLSRYSGWSVNLTMQATRNASTDLDPFTGTQRSVASGWQHFFSGGASFEQQRLFGIPRLRHTLQLTLNSQQLERRALGDIDAPRERITQSLESRIDYSIGRLDLRFSARQAQVDGKSIASIHARLLRRF